MVGSIEEQESSSGEEVMDSSAWRRVFDEAIRRFDAEERRRSFEGIERHAEILEMLSSGKRIRYRSSRERP
jgi:hypothetical protein